MHNEYKVYIVGDKEVIHKLLADAQDEDIIESYSIEDN